MAVRKHFILLLFLFPIIYNSCQETDEYVSSFPAGFPELDIPEDNPMTKSKIALGKKLFFDKDLSRDSTISCGSCHFAQNAMADPKRFSIGVYGQEGTRNAPSLANVAYGTSFFRDGGVPTLEIQVISPIESHEEMDIPIVDVADRLNKNPEYVKLFKKVFNDEVTPFGITRAISAYERTMISGNSAYDKYKYQEDSSALNASELRGMNLFFSDELNCSSCHTGFNFTNNEFENNGLYDDYEDIGRMRIVIDSANYGKFKVPTLRNVEVTAPYMHDGSINTLFAVVEHYASGGADSKYKSELITGFEISAQEQEDLVNFLKSLTDKDFITNPNFTP